MKYSINRLTTAALVLMTAGCSEDNPYDDYVAVEGPVATASTLVYADQASNELLFVHPNAEKLELARQELGSEDSVIEWMQPTLNREQLLVLTVPASEKAEDVAEELLLVSADGESEPKRWTVDAPFDALAQSPDGRHVVLYFGAVDASSPLQNANLVAIVDLEDDEFHRVTLNGFGGRLSDVQFPGLEIEVAGTPRNLAVFIADGEVVLVDMNAPESNQVAFGVEGFDPEAILLRDADDMMPDPTLFIRGSSSPDVARLTLIEKREDDRKVLTTTVSMISVGQASDFALYNGEEVPYLVTLSGLGNVLFTDIGTENGFLVDLSASADRLFLREHNGGSQLVAWRQGGNALYTLDLEDIESTLGRTPDQLKIESGVQRLVQLDNDRVLIGSGQTLYVVDFTRDLVTPLTAASVYDPASSALFEDRLLLGTPSQRYVSAVDLRALDPQSMLLDREIATFHYLDEVRRIVVTHDDPAGSLTVVDADDLSRSSSYGAWGYLLEGSLD